MSSLGGTSSTYWFCTIDSTSVKSRSCSYVAPLSVPLLATEPPSERVSTTSKEPITNAFFMESPRSRVASAPLSEPLFRVLRLALVTHLEIEARPLQRARVPHCPDALSLLHVVAFLHDDIGNVRVQRVVLVVVVQDAQVSVPLEPARVHDVPGEHGRHVAALPGLDVHAVAERPSSEPGMHLSAERADHTALRRPRQPAPESTETHGRGSFGARLRRRDPGLASLLGLEVADERLQSSRRLGELAHHPLVVRALVADLRQQDAALGGVPIDFALLTLGIRPECRQVLLPALFPAAAILQTVCRPTILLNEAGVQRGEAGEVPDGRRPRRRILSRQQHRQRAPLHVDLVHGAQAPAEGCLLAGTLGLELQDLAAQRLHVARRALDPGVEPDDLALLVRQTLLDHLQLGEHRGLARARLRRLLLFLAQLLLRLLQPLLLGRDRIVGLLRCRLRRRHPDGQRDAEARRGDHRAGAGAAAEGVAGARAHRSARPRASQPPNPPSMVPAHMSTTTVCGRRNVSRSSPTVWLTSGSSRGPAIV